jgi:hypothetical protein
MEMDSSLYKNTRSLICTWVKNLPKLTLSPRVKRMPDAMLVDGKGLDDVSARTRIKVARYFFFLLYVKIVNVRWFSGIVWTKRLVAVLV